MDLQELMDLSQQAIDSDGSGTISLAEFASFLNDDLYRSFFEVRGIDIKDAAMFFDLLSKVAGTNEVQLDLFVEGCLRLKGPATCIDMQVLRYEVTSLNKLCERNFHLLQQLHQINRQ